MPRPRERLVSNLESLYRERQANVAAGEEETGRAELDFSFRRDQIFLEALLDIRDLLAASAPPAKGEESEESLLKQLEELRRLTRPFGR